MQRMCRGAGGQPQSTFEEERRHLLCPALLQAIPFSRLLRSLQQASIRVGCKGKGQAGHGADWGSCPGPKEGSRSRRPSSGARHPLPRCTGGVPHIGLVYSHDLGWTENLCPAGQLKAGADVFFENKLERLKPLLPASPPMAGPQDAQAEPQPQRAQAREGAPEEEEGEPLAAPPAAGRAQAGSRAQPSCPRCSGCPRGEARFKDQTGAGEHPRPAPCPTLKHSSSCCSRSQTPSLTRRREALTPLITNAKKEATFLLFPSL